METIFYEMLSGKYTEEKNVYENNQIETHSFSEENLKNFDALKSIIRFDIKQKTRKYGITA